MVSKGPRYRERTLFGSNAPFVTIRYQFDGHSENYGSLDPTVYEYMTDWSGEKGMNPVDHVRREYDRCSWSLPMAPNSHNSNCMKGTSFSYGAGFRSKRTVFEAKPNWSEPMKALLEDSKGNLSQSVNLIVNIAEAAEIKTIVPQIIKTGKRLIRSGKGWMSLRDMASMHLLYSFGVAPLVKDVASAFAINRKIVARRQELRHRNEKPVRILKRGFNKTEDRWTEPDIVASGDWTASVRCHGSATVKTAVGATCKAFYNVDHPSTNWNLVSQALGLNRPLTTAWELVPFSFVFDWFVPIGNALKEVERLGLNLVDEASVTKSYALTEFCMSEKHEATISPVGTITSSTWIPSYRGKRIGMETLHYKRYTRSVGGNPLIEFLDPSGNWSIGRAALGCSLMIQKVNNTKKPGPQKWPKLEEIFTKGQHVRRK